MNWTIDAQRKATLDTPADIAWTKDGLRLGFIDGGAAFLRAGQLFDDAPAEFAADGTVRAALALRRLDDLAIDPHTECAPLSDYRSMFVDLARKHLHETEYL